MMKFCRKLFSNMWHANDPCVVWGRILGRLITCNDIWVIIAIRSTCQFYETNNSGDFYFVINEPEVQEMVIQAVTPVQGDYNVELKPDFSNAFDHYLPGPFYPDTNKLEALNNNIISMQIENIYKPYRQNSHKITDGGKQISFYGEPEYSIQISYYIQLTTVKEVIKEIYVDLYKCI